MDSLTDPHSTVVGVVPIAESEVPLIVQLAIAEVGKALQSLDGLQALQVLLSSIYSIAKINSAEVKRHIAALLVDTANHIHRVD